MALRIGIVGTGRTVGIAAQHAAAIQNCAGAQLTAVYNRTAHRAHSFVRALCPTAAVCGSYDELLRTVDAVVICTPNRYHSSYAAAALSAGKAVLLEKPMAVDIEDSRRAAAAAAQSGAFAMVGYVYRYAPHTAALKKLAQQRLGRIYTLSASFGGQRLADPRLPLEWRMLRAESGPGALADFGSHLLDLCGHICGLVPQTLHCTLQTDIPTRPAGPGGGTRVENDDSAAVCGRGQNGETFILLLSRTGLDGPHLCLTGEGGLARADFASGTLEFQPKEPGGGYSGETQRIALPHSPRQAWFDRQMQDFVAGAGGQAVDVCSFAQGLLIEEYISAAAKSAQNRTE